MSNITSEPSNTQKKKALGRGLGSLLGDQSISIKKEESNQMMSGEAPAVTTQELAVNNQMTTKNTNEMNYDSKVWQVDIIKIKPGLYQPRQNFEKEKIEELAQSIKQNGILQPIVVRKANSGSLEIIAGERRWRAAQMAGLHEVPVIVKNVGNKEALELAIIENIQRENLSPIEEAEAYSRLAEEFSMTQQQVAEKVGKERATVANAIRLLSLPFEIKDLISANELSVGHAKVLLGLNLPEKQIEYAKKAIKGKLTVRKLEKLILDEQKPEAKELLENIGITEKLVKGIAEDLQKKLGTKVNIDYSEGKGKINLYFYSDDELSGLVEKLKSAR